MRKKFEIDLVGLIWLITFGAWLAVDVIEFSQGKTPYVALGLTVLNYILVRAFVAPVKKTKPIGALYFFKGETHNHVTVGLDIQANPIDVLSMEEATLKIVDQTDEQPSTSIPRT